MTAPATLDVICRFKKPGDAIYPAWLPALVTEQRTNYPVRSLNTIHSTQLKSDPSKTFSWQLQKNMFLAISSCTIHRTD